MAEKTENLDKQFTGHAKFPPMQRHTLGIRTRMEHLSTLSYRSPSNNFRLTTLLCPLSLITKDVHSIETMIAAGITGFRIVCAFGNVDKNMDAMKRIQQAVANQSAKMGLPVCVSIIAELRGKEIRIGWINGDEKGSVRVNDGAMITLTISSNYMQIGNAEKVFVDFEDLIRVAQPGMTIFVNFGSLKLMCVSVLGSYITCKVITGGMLGSLMKLHFCGVDLPVQSDIPEKDKIDIDAAYKMDVDMIMVSTVTCASVVKLYRDYLEQNGYKNMLIVSRIDTTEGVENVEEIAKISDAVLIARNNLAIEMRPAYIFKAQKKITAVCRKLNKPVILSSQLLDSMLYGNVPKCTETIDIANAVMDGADAISFFHETTHGEDPFSIIESTDKICREAEAAMIWNVYNNIFIHEPRRKLDETQAAALTAVNLANRVLASAMIIFTMTGVTASNVSKYMPQCPVIAVTRYPHTFKLINLLRSIHPLLYTEKVKNTWLKETEAKIEYAIKYAKVKGMIKAGDPIVILKSWKLNSGFKNTIRLEYGSQFLDEVAI